LGKASGVAPSNRIVMGCIGVGGKRPGGQGTIDLQGFMGREEVQVVAVCDVDTVHRNWARDIVDEKYGNKDCSTYNDFRELLARDDIDAVSIVLPDHWHAIPAVMAARAGKDIFSQKPLAYNIAEGRAICDAVKKYGVVWQTGNSLRSTRNARFVCELVRNERIGFGVKQDLWQCLKDLIMICGWARRHGWLTVPVGVIGISGGLETTQAGR